MWLAVCLSPQGILNHIEEVKTTLNRFLWLFSQLIRQDGARRWGLMESEGRVKLKLMDMRKVLIVMKG